MPTTPLFPLPQGLELTSNSEASEEVIVRVTSHRPTSRCPLCGVSSSRIHSYYRRKPRDLPCAGRPIRLLLTVKNFVCQQAECPRKIFTERLPDLIEVSSRLTKRLRSAVQRLALPPAAKEESAWFEARHPLSDATLLWSLYLVPLPPIGRSKSLGLTIGVIGAESGSGASLWICVPTRSSIYSRNEASNQWWPGSKPILKSRS